MSSYSIQIAKYLVSDTLVTSMRVNRHAEIIFLKLLSSKVRIFTNLPIFEGENEDVRGTGPSMITKFAL